MKKPLADFYVTNLTDPNLPFTAVIEMTALVEREQFGGHALVYLPKYAAPNDPIFQQSDEGVRESFVCGLENMYPAFRREDVLAFRISRVKHVFPIPTLNYSQKLPAMSSTVPGIHIVNSSHIVNGTLNVNETVQLAERSMMHLLSAAGTTRRFEYANA
jgi:protoporphyrinogen oxidase